MKDSLTHGQWLSMQATRRVLDAEQQTRGVKENTMFEFQINVSLGGRHFFRTDWIDTEEHALRVVRDLAVKFGAMNVDLVKRSRVRSTVDYHTEGESDRAVQALHAWVNGKG